MNYTQDMNLLSTSGYCMPFEEKDRDVQLTLRYGKQKHPKTGESFFHHGIDFKTNNYFLAAVADGVVSGIGIDRKQYGLYVVIKYSKYEVTYSHMSNVFMQFGQQVKAGLAVGVSSDLLHMEVKYDGEEIDPVEFITMLYGNAKTWSEKGKAQPEFVAIDMDVHTDYDKDKDEIEKLMMRFFANYMNDLHEGLYSCPQRTEQSLRHLFSAAAMKDYFYESMPSMVNPLGIGRRSVPLVSKVQNLLIGDFLNYMALRHQIFLSTMTSLEKKKAEEQALSDGILIDPLAGLDIDIQSFDIPRIVSVYPDQAGLRWWTKSWFNNSEDGEAAIEIEREQAIRFLLNQIDKEEWLEEYFPKQMEMYHNAIEQTKEQLLQQSI